MIELFCALLFSAFLCFSVYSGKLLLLVSEIYAAMSLITFALYGMDKYSATKGKWRIPEKTLHLFELSCGWPGAAFGQQLFRHKTRKISFRVLFWICVILNSSAFALLYLKGTVFLRSVWR